MECRSEYSPLAIRRTLSTLDQVFQSKSEITWCGRHVMDHRAKRQDSSLPIIESAQVKLCQYSGDLNVKEGATLPPVAPIDHGKSYAHSPHAVANPIFTYLAGRAANREASCREAALLNPSVEQRLSKLSGRRGMRYEDLTAPDKTELRQSLIKDNFCYAAFMYNGAAGQRPGAEQGLQFMLNPSAPDRLKKIGGTRSKISHQEYAILLAIAQGVIKIGLNVDEYGQFYDQRTGTIFTLVFDVEKKEVSVCFMGLGSAANLQIPQADQERLNRAALIQVAFSVGGALPAAADLAMKIGDLLKKETTDTNIHPVMVGHSHGGALAQIAAIRHGLRAVVFNAEPIGIQAKKLIDKEIGKEKRQQYAAEVTAFSNKEDWLTDGMIQAICCFGRDIGFPVPTVMGKGYSLPKVSNRWSENHCDFYTAFCHLASI